jgi:hypothetical protein
VTTPSITLNYILKIYESDFLNPSLYEKRPIQEKETIGATLQAWNGKLSDRKPIPYQNDIITIISSVGRGALRYSALLFGLPFVSVYGTIVDSFIWLTHFISTLISGNYSDEPLMGLKFDAEVCTICVLVIMLICIFIYATMAPLTSGIACLTVDDIINITIGIVYIGCILGIVIFVIYQIDTNPKDFFNTSENFSIRYLNPPVWEPLFLKQEYGLVNENGNTLKFEKFRYCNNYIHFFDAFIENKFNDYYKKVVVKFQKIPLFYDVAAKNCNPTSFESRLNDCTTVHFWNCSDSSNLRSHIRKEIVDSFSLIADFLLDEKIQMTDENLNSISCIKAIRTTYESNPHYENNFYPDQRQKNAFRDIIKLCTNYLSQYRQEFDCLRTLVTHCQNDPFQFDLFWNSFIEDNNKSYAQYWQKTNSRFFSEFNRPYNSHFSNINSNISSPFIHNYWERENLIKITDLSQIPHPIPEFRDSLNSYREKIRNNASWKSFLDIAENCNSHKEIIKKWHEACNCLHPDKSGQNEALRKELEALSKCANHAKDKLIPRPKPLLEPPKTTSN